MNKIVFIADLFVDQMIGGGELNNEELINLLKERGHKVEKQNSYLVDVKYLASNEDSFFIVSNFFDLSYECKDWLCYNANYIIYEHDHKYLEFRNPAVFENFKAPIKEIRNYFFYKNAKKIFCQSNFHKDIVEKNLQLSNIISVGGNLWSLNSFKKLRELLKIEKSSACSIMDSIWPHKNPGAAIQYCKSKNLKYELISDDNYIEFLEKLGKNQKLVFFPGTPETLSRIVCEARMMGMSVVTNQLVGAAQEEWFSLKGAPLIEHMINKRDEICNLVINEIKASHKKISLPKVSIITTFHKGEEYLEEYLKDITQQSMFSQCELILIDSASPGKERKIVEKYQKKFDNIRYYRYERLFPPPAGHNLAILKSRAEYVVYSMLDDRKSVDSIETLYNEIISDDTIELVYGDCLSTDIKNETFAQTKSNSMSEHSLNSFSRENMIKCLPGPMPLWRKRLHEKCGFFDEDNHNFSDDWELWLRAVDSGCKFKKVDKTVGLYLVGGRSQLDNNIDQRKEEAKIFFKYAHVFGHNYTKYEPYFRQFLDH